MSTTKTSMPKRFMAWLDACNLRERLLVFLTAVAALYLLMNGLVFMPQERELTQLRNDMLRQRTELDVLLLEIQTLGTQLAEDPDAATRQHLDDLRQALRELQAPLAALTSGLVHPRDMARLVESIVRGQAKLRVVKMENLPPDTLQTLETVESVREAALYKHGMRIVVQGGYRDLVAFFSALETLQWKVLWHEIDVQTERFPLSTATLTLYTLSTERAWMGL